MELWIRSQDKRICNYADDYKTELGIYKSKTRALEVLDEIQRYILLPNIDNSTYLYQMPEK